MYIHERFDTRDERDTRLFELRGLYKHVVKYTDSDEGKVVWWVAYPVPIINSTEELAESLERKINNEPQQELGTTN